MEVIGEIKCNVMNKVSLEDINHINQSIVNKKLQGPKINNKTKIKRV